MRKKFLSLFTGILLTVFFWHVNFIDSGYMTSVFDRSPLGRSDAVGFSAANRSLILY